MTILYGIPNCDTVKKARVWLADKGIAFEFVDFKKQPPQEALIRQWLTQIPLETLLNKRGTTWRKLNPEEQAAAANPDDAVRLMAEQPSVIKRPVLSHEGRFYCGFSADSYQAVFKD
ncbi:MAG: arsenate reductase [Neisseria sp.]|uniref:arsenate reductase n=1 Tax=Neisseria sp. TaxID=192066 RepID=UPI0026DA7B49|nr:arsenate reductase [Neisseria sp.]MDO4640170.1 arsenate reductase [Neisseria sp.]